MCKNVFTWRAEARNLQRVICIFVTWPMSSFKAAILAFIVAYKNVFL